MDDLGNRTGQVTQRDGTHTYSVDSLTNRYTQIDAATITHDDAGNMTGDKDGYVYFYDYENRIVKIEDDASSTVATFEYDALGRRIRKVDSIASVTTLYYYDPDWRCLEERDGSDILQRSFIYGNYIDEVLVMTVPGSPPTDYYYLHDHLYSPAALLAADGTVVERYEYDAYGTVHIFDGSWNTRSASAYGNPYFFQGHLLDRLDNGGLEIMEWRHRTYDSFSGRWLTPDKLGLLSDAWDGTLAAHPIQQYAYGLNPYEFVGGAPMSHTDAMGLAANWSPKDSACDCRVFRNKEKGGHELIRCGDDNWGFYPSGSIWGSPGVVKGPGGHPTFPQDVFDANEVGRMWVLAKKTTGVLSFVTDSLGNKITCDCASCAQITLCIRNFADHTVRIKKEYHLRKYNCRTWVKEALARCCLKKGKMTKYE